MVFVVAIVAGLVTLAAWLVATRRKERRRRARFEKAPPIPLLIPTAAARAPAPRPAATPPAVERRSPTPIARPRSAAAARAPDVERPIVPAGEPEVSATVHFQRPAEEAVQLLPGRLEVLAGERRHKEIRLVRVPGEAAEVIIGRERIDAPGHVALQSSTVSRRHARLAFADGRWKVANLSGTNPLVVNDEALSQDAERTLVDGDRLELGEVVLRFHAR